MEAEDENYFRNEIRKNLESVEDDDNDASKLYTKKLFTLKPTPQFDDSSVIELGVFKWIFIARRSQKGTSLHFKLFADRDNNPRLNFYALNTVAIIHPLDYRLTECSDRFHSVCNAHLGYVFDLERACERGFLDAEGNVKVELQIQIFGENVFAPLLVNKYRTELFLASMHIVDKICSSFIENTKDNLKSKWSRFCTFMEESGQISVDQMVVGLEYKPIYESIVTNFGCMIVEIFVLDYLFRNKIEVNFTRSELNRTEKKSNKKRKKAKPKKNDKCVEENRQTQNDESIAADLEEDTFILDSVAALYLEAEKESGENFIQFFDIERKMEAEDENYSYSLDVK
ncbi:hypothetical protein P8452_62727 [Trifolium repens]|nr:hypothetical protein P8452_62727 [Trifolium repens]